MPSYTVSLLGKRQIAKGTFAFDFQKPAGFHFKAGQYVILSLIEPGPMDAKGPMRDLSIASAPFEQQLTVAMRMRDSSFKRALALMPHGATVRIQGPMGDFTLHDPTRPAIFLVGGIGITPVRSIALQAAADEWPGQVLVFFSNRNIEDSPFLSDLVALNHPRFKLIGTLTDKKEPMWSGESGHITMAMIQKHAPYFMDGIFYLVGPPAFTQAMKAMLEKAGVERIKEDVFDGY